jgi:hypothetical protein
LTFRDRECQRLANLRDRRFKDPGGGLYSGVPRDFVLAEPVANLWEGIRADAIDYFKRNNIAWWNRDGSGPTGHLCGSQVSCVNHLYLLRQRQIFCSTESCRCRLEGATTHAPSRLAAAVLSLIVIEAQPHEHRAMESCAAAK